MSHAAAILAGPVYGGYQYAYPHKTAYRPLGRPVPLREAWAEEPKTGLFLYAHIPFCAMRCGFCNLFTLTRGEGRVGPYLDALRLQAETVAESLGPLRVARMAIGGGTPTFLDPPDLDRLFCDLRATFGASPALVPTSVETAPGTTTPDRLAVLRAHGVERISIGVESFRGDETRAMGRPQSREAVEAALRAIRDAGIPVLNIDLIYGAAGQTPARFLDSVEAALAWEPEELFLYPLYVRPLTGLGRRGGSTEDDRPGMRAASRSTAPPATGFAPPAMPRSRCGCSGAGPRRCGAPPMIAPATAWWDWAPGRAPTPPPCITRRPTRWDRPASPRSSPITSPARPAGTGGPITAPGSTTRTGAAASC